MGNFFYVSLVFEGETEWSTIVIIRSGGPFVLSDSFDFSLLNDAISIVSSSRVFIKDIEL